MQLKTKWLWVRIGPQWQVDGESVMFEVAFLPRPDLTPEGYEVLAALKIECGVIGRTRWEIEDEAPRQLKLWWGATQDIGPITRSVAILAGQDIWRPESTVLR